MPPIGQREITSNGLVMPNGRGDEQDDITNWLALDQMISGTHPIVRLSPNQGGASFIDARDFGVRPGSSNSLRSELSTALNAAASEGKVLLLQSGVYNYDNTIDVTGGGGMVCLNGRAKLNAQNPTYNLNRISFNGASESNPYVGFHLEGIDFDNVTMPNTGLSNGASEFAGFISLTNIRDVYVARNRVVKNFGGFILIRNVFDALIENNFCKDLWKDVFHTTGSSRNVVRKGNRVYNCGDDAFASVGYLSQNSRPEYIYDFDNYVYGCRRGRAFAYVGAAHVRGRNFVDGRVINPFQALSPNGHYYRGSCALYIASESGFGTYGCEDVDFHIDARYMGPTVITPGGGPVSNATESTNSLSVVRIAESSSADNTAIKNINVRGTIENSPRINVFVTGCENLNLDMKVVDNTDSEGWVGAAGTYSAQMTEFQSLRGNNKIRVDAKNSNHMAAVFTGTCRGNLDVSVKINDVLKTVVQDGVSFLSGSIFDNLSIEVDLDWNIPSGRLDGLMDVQCSVGELNVKLGGKGSANNVAWLGSGITADPVTLTGSPQVVTNMTDDDINVLIRGGTVSAVHTARVGLQWARPVASVSGNVLTIAGDVSTVYTTGRHCVFVGRGAGPAELGTIAIPISAVNFSGGNTSVTLASAPPAAGVYDRVAPLFSDAFVAIDGSVNRLLRLPRGRALRVTYSAAPTILSIPAKQ